MTHYNRKDLLYKTLCSISKLYYGDYDYEIVIVDDASTNCDITDFLDFPNTKIIFITKEQKGIRTNPSVPYNIGFKSCIGDKILIQNAENFHMGNSLDIIEKQLTDVNYLSFACYQLTKYYTNKLNDIDFTGDFIIETLKLINPLNNVFMGSENENGWYNHSVYRPCAYHFMNAITKNNLYKLRGFDERFALGSSFDDDDFLFRIKRLDLHIEFIDNVYCIHQFHGFDTNAQTKKSWELNRNLLEKTKKESSCQAKISIL